MSAALLLTPFLLIRFGLLAVLGKGALKRAAYFAPMQGREKIEYWVYQILNVLIFVYLFSHKIKTAPAPVFYGGIILYIAGMILLILSVLGFAAVSENCMNKSGIYKISRNPMYLSYYIFFVGCAFLTQSGVLFSLVQVFQISTHTIILAEERWCIEQFGEEYLQYMSKVRRYI